MIRSQFILPIAHELIVDLFAGGGGASTGIEQATGRHVDIAINHDPEAVSLHQANHPQTQHHVSDVFEVDPVAVCEGRPVGLLWASPDCKHFSKAKGGKPVSKRVRSLAWVVVKWAKAVRPRVICLENVEEFQTWGPLGRDNLPCPRRKGRTFARWLSSLRALGYVVESRELRACDYGAPTIRKRFFLVARCDGAPIVWPEATHGAPDSPGVRAKKLKPWRTAADCIDWSIPCPSIFERAKPLAEATCRRIAKGVMRYVVHAAHPFIVPMTHTGGDRVHSITEPVRTITTAQRGELALAVPTLVQTGYGERDGQAPRALDIGKPLGTAVGSQKHALVTAFLAQYNNHSGADPHTGRSATAPMSTITTAGSQQAVVAANLVHMGHGEGKDGGKRRSHGVRGVDQPLNTVTASGMPAGLVASHMAKLRGTNLGSAADEPLHTISAGGTHHAAVRAFLVKYYGEGGQDQGCAEPMHTVPTRDRFGLVAVKGELYAIADIGLRMLAPRELYRAQGFPDSYAIDKGADGRPLTKTAQVRMCGNSVCPPLAKAIVGANFSDFASVRRAA